jgi:hypothetical protein
VVGLLKSTNVSHSALRCAIEVKLRTMERRIGQSHCSLRFRVTTIRSIHFLWMDMNRLPPCLELPIARLPTQPPSHSKHKPNTPLRRPSGLPLAYPHLSTSHPWSPCPSYPCQRHYRPGMRTQNPSHRELSFPTSPSSAVQVRC